MITLDEALALLDAAVLPLPTEQVALAAAAGRVLAAPVVARRDSPRHAVAAMDGYAVCDAATRPGQPVKLIGEARAGARFAGTLSPGEAVRIFTGAAMPAGADRCIMQEYATREGEAVRFADGYGPGWHVRSAGSDFAAGAVLLEAGTRLGPRQMITAAAADQPVLELCERPRVALIATGDELVPSGSAHDSAGSIPESVSFGLAALAVAAGARIACQTIGCDDLAKLEALAGEALAQADIVVVSGGASVGERDFAKPMFAPHGLELIFSKIAIKPGKPVWLGRAQGRWVLGLPGNPTSAMVTARLLLLPLIAGLQGRPFADVMRWRHLPLAAPLAATGARETLVRAAWDDNGLRPIGNQDSGAQAALAQADWLIRCPPDQPARAAGEVVSALDFAQGC